MTLQTDIQKLVTDALPNAAPGSGYGYIAPDAAHVCGGVGVSNIATKAPFTALTRFRICSVTKQFTTVLTMMAAAEGLLKISDHPKLYYPDLGCDHPHLTLRYLMTNQSGIKDYWCVAMTMGARPETQFTRAHTDMLLAAPLQLDFEPGSQFAYSNTNFALLGRILDLVYRQPFAALVHDKLFAPLGMANSFVPASTAVPLPGNPQGYEDEGLPADVNLSWEGDAGIISTIADMQRWQSAQLDANHWLQTYFKACYAPGNFKDGGIASYRCGIRRIEREGGLELAHTGGLRGWRMASVLRPESGEAALVMLNH
ncbi:MAG: serine hydrolase, partial [Pseudomonadota bacterium]